MFYVGQRVRVDLSEYPHPLGGEVDGETVVMPGEVSITGRITGYHGRDTNGSEWVVRLDVSVANVDLVVIQEQFLQAVA